MQIMRLFTYYKGFYAKELVFYPLPYFGKENHCFCPVILPKNGHLKSSK